MTVKDGKTTGNGLRAWQIVERVGGRGLTIGGAKMSEKHCNFMINTGTATAADLEDLGEELIRRAKNLLNLDLHWEIRRIGERPPVEAAVVATNEHRTYVKSLAGQVKVLEIESGKSTTLGPQQSLQVPPPPPVKFTPKSPAKGPEAAGTPSP